MTRSLQIAGSLLLLFLSPVAFGASSFELDSLREKHHVTADRTLYHSNEKVYEAFGHVVVSSHGQRLSADYLWVDDNTKDIKARGNVIFVDRTTTVQAAEIHLNLETGIGSIFYGKVFNDLYTLKGQLIRRVADDRFLTTEGEYTTCKDCAESWKLSARYVDLTMEGYAFLDSVFIKIKDVPTLYIPYVILPVKTKRQSGLLFPRMGANSNNGFVFVQPVFLAISPHQDLTLGAGRYSTRGMRYEGEYRYRSYNGIHGQFNYYHTGDRRPEAPKESRVALKTENEWSFAKNFGMRWRATEVFDREYIYDFPEDIQGQGYPSLESNAIATAPFDDFYASVEARRYRNMLTTKKTGFDGGTVQALPTAHLGMKERSIVGPLLGSFNGRYDNYTRRNGPFSDQNANGYFDPNFNSALQSPELIRETRRFIFSPEISAPFRLGRYLNIGPSAQYNEIRYDFAVPVGGGKNLPHTYTRYVQTKLETSTVLEKVYEYDGKEVSRVKHQLSPFVTLSYIPWISQDQSHPFQQQVNNRPEGLFDQYDAVPVTNSTSFLRYPQGKSVYYGFNSRVIRKMKNLSEIPREYPYDLLPAAKPRKYPSPQNRKEELSIASEQLWEKYNPHYEEYQEIWNLNVSQAFDFIDAKRHADDPKRAFSYLLAKSAFSIPFFRHDFEYKFFPRILPPVAPGAPFPEPLHNKHIFTTGLTWEWIHLANLRKTRSFIRSISLNYSNSSQPNPSRSASTNLVWSVNDFVGFKAGYGYDLMASKQQAWDALAQVTHPSECWGLAFRYNWNRYRSPNKGEVGFELLLNLMGTGFTGFNREGGSGGVFGGG